MSPLNPLQVFSECTVLAIGMAEFYWSLQHSFMPLTFDPGSMLLLLLSSIPNSVFMIVVYLRLRHLLPLAIVHWLMDGASVVLPLLQQ
ncbi:hypothetical protein [Pseudaminobacter sp. NGMCC 1.201702]|uniref:hypothetical protein n=1 Tax=Pseudaminobacter sp. NGMCC 1.201702 TaxID=3391825 RepID=UPI0039EEB38A